MKRCVLIISDCSDFRDWVGNHVTTRWPNIMIEYSRLANAPMYLDRAPLERYRLIIVRLSFQSYISVATCIFLMRVLNLETHPEIVFIAESADELKSVRSTKLGAARCLLASELTSPMMQSVLASIASNDEAGAVNPGDGAPNIPGYKIRHPIAGTYTATVYRAFSEALGTDVALKICEIKSLENGLYHQLSLRQEYEILRKLGGEFVANAYDYGEIGGVGYMAMEYFPRGTVKQVIAESDRSVSRLQYMLGVATALRKIHNAGFLHLDLKPNNVLIREDGTPALIDFGISKRIVAARYQDIPVYSMGSPYFMSPEQARGEPLDERSDIYSFGALWYRVFTGRAPFGGKTLDQILEARSDGTAPSMGDALRHYQPIVDGTLKMSPDDRFENAQVLVEKIEEYAATAMGMHKVDLQKLRFQLSLNTARSQSLPQPETAAL